MKKTSKKIFGGLMIAGLLATIGAVVASAHPGFFFDLTDEQIEGLRERRQELRDEGATWEEIREAMCEQLDEYDVELPTREEMIDMRIKLTQQRLNILKRTKELVQDNPDITNEEIREIIQEEFELEMPGEGFGMMHRRGFRRGPCFGYGPNGFMKGQESEL